MRRSLRVSVSVEGLDLGHQLVGVDGLDDVVAGALAHAPHLVGFLVLAGAHDHRHIDEARVASDRSRQLKAILARHHHVHQDQVRLVFTQPAHRVFVERQDVAARQVDLARELGVGLDSPERMEADARAAAARFPLLKLKLAGEGDVARVAAVRRGAPAARLIVDANEAWTGRDVAAEAAVLAPLGVELIEQPVAAGQDALLDGIESPIPLCADESCQDRADLARCIGRYQAINIKLDKAGGLTEALALGEAAREAGLELMVGCMLATSLGVAPAFLAAQHARWVDLDGPLLLTQDRRNGFAFEGATMPAAGRELWG